MTDTPYKLIIQHRRGTYDVKAYINLKGAEQVKFMLEHEQHYVKSIVLVDETEGYINVPEKIECNALNAISIFSTCFKLDGFKVDVRLMNIDTHNILRSANNFIARRFYYEYRFYDNGVPIFDGNDFSIAMSGNFENPLILNQAGLADLFGFLTLKPGDIDDEHFDDYTLDQLAWVKGSRGEELAVIYSDLDEGASYSIKDGVTLSETIKDF